MKNEKEFLRIKSDEIMELANKKFQKQMMMKPFTSDCAMLFIGFNLTLIIF